MREGEGTKFTIDRKIFSSDIWYASPWKLKIWIYLVGSANHKDGEWMGIKLKRGELIRSYRRIQKDCSYKIGYRTKKPSLNTISRICEDLTKELRTERRTEHGAQIITILNYDELQPMKKNERNGEGKDRGTIGEHNKNDKNKTFLSDSQEIRLSNLLFELILKNNSSAKKPNFQIWAKAIDLMIRIDKRSLADIEKVICWCQKDDFWHTNILSTAKLRKQFDQLSLKMGGGKVTPKKKILTGNEALHYEG